jgi:hypothetical protein
MEPLTVSCQNLLADVKTSLAYPPVIRVTQRNRALYIDWSISRTLRQCAPSHGHPATRYADFLTGMTKIITAEPMNAPGRSDTQATLDAGGFMRDQDWLDLWQDSGLDQNWLFGSIGDVA